MKEGSKRREWVKTAAIVFLSVMLVLTFFSNTIMNYSLPEVATQYVQSGTITAKIRGTGVVESGDPYNVEVTESRKVASVAVRNGDEVKKGDVLIYLEDEESEELKAALETLAAAEKNYEKALLNADITEADIKAANSGKTAEDFRKQITSLQNAIAAVDAKIKPIEAHLAGIEQMLADISAQMSLENASDAAAAERVSVTLTAKDNAYAYAKKCEEEWEKKWDASVAAAVALNEEKAKENPDPNRVAELEQNWLNAVNEEKQAQEVHKNALTAAEEAERTYNDAVSKDNERKTSQVKANLSESQAIYEIEKYNAQKELQTAQDEKTAKEEELQKLTANMGNVVNLIEYIAAVNEARHQVDELNAKSKGATIVAPIAGTISSINVVAGETTSAAVPVMVMQPEGSGMTLSFTVTNEQARKLSVGDKADLVNAWRYDDVEVTLASIKVDKNNPGQQKQLTFNVKGDVVPGQSLSLSVGQKSANYDYIVPNSAIREDNNGKFILIVESKASPLGTRYTASRVDVQVVASDDTQSAITGGVSGYEFVITTSTKPVQAGELVRLAD